MAEFGRVERDCGRRITTARIACGRFSVAEKSAAGTGDRTVNPCAFINQHTRKDGLWKNRRLAVVPVSGNIPLAGTAACR